MSSVNGKKIQSEQETGFRLSSVNGKKIQNEQETGFRLSSVNGKSVEQLVASYKSAGINQTNLNNAYAILSRTKDEREQSQTQIQTQSDFEGR